MIETVQTTLKKEGKPYIYWKDKLQQKKIPTPLLSSCEHLGKVDHYFRANGRGCIVLKKQIRPKRRKSAACQELVPREGTDVNTEKCSNLPAEPISPSARSQGPEMLPYKQRELRKRWETNSHILKLLKKERMC